MEKPKSIYRKKSKLVGKCRSDIGYGCFAAEVIAKRSFIAYFIGALVSNAEYNSKPESAKGYAHYFDKGKVFDCYDYAKANLCTASMANSPHRTTTKFANCKVVVDHRNQRVYLRAITDIQLDEELVYFYGSTYTHYPSCVRKYCACKI